MPGINDHTRRRFIKAAGSVSTVGVLAGCLNNGSDDGGSEGTPTDQNPDSDSNSVTHDDLDFGGETLHVNLNVAGGATVQQNHIIPKVEEEYNLNIEADTSATTEQLATLQANPENPPDVLNLDTGGVIRAVRNDWLEPFTDYKDLLTNLENIEDEFIYYDEHAAAWQLMEIAPVINTNRWDSPPESWDEAIKNTEEAGLIPWSWGAGPFLLIMASALATGEDASSDDLNVDAGFDYLQEHLAPNVSTTFGGTSESIQLLTSGSVDSLMPTYTYTLFDPYHDGTPVEPLSGLEPTGLVTGQTVSVTKASEHKEAAMAYINEVLKAEFQERAADENGLGVTNAQAEISAAAKEFGIPTASNFDKFSQPNFEFIQENRDDWTDRWREIFS